ncbi:hypothetical protein BsWGS_11275 [Bradybaena similaris]
MALTPRSDMSQFRAIVLVAVDDSEPAEFAFNWYRDYIHRPDYFTVVLHCTDHADHDNKDTSSGIRRGSTDTHKSHGLVKAAKISKENMDRIKRIEDKFGQLMDINEIKGKIRKGIGKPGEAIVKAAAEEGATMIVTGTRGLSKLKRAFVASVSDYVVHNSPVPVITCRRH